MVIMKFGILKIQYVTLFVESIFLSNVIILWKIIQLSLEKRINFASLVLSILILLSLTK